MKDLDKALGIEKVGEWTLVRGDFNINPEGKKTPALTLAMRGKRTEFGICRIPSISMCVDTSQPLLCGCKEKPCKHCGKKCVYLGE